MSENFGKLSLKETQAIAEFANTEDSDETAHNEPSHLDLQCFEYSTFLFLFFCFDCGFTSR